MEKSEMKVIEKFSGTQYIESDKLAKSADC